MDAEALRKMQAQQQLIDEMRATAAAGSKFWMKFGEI
eukprot:COSAG04_NODE_788_length_10303_cov_33.536946_11_plen_37_part_00